MKYISFITATDAKTGQMSLPNGKRKVFISYKHSDEAHLPLCRRLASYILEKLDVAVWFDRQLTAGAEYDAEIRGVIEQSDVFILLLTPQILNSKYIVETEIPLAIRNQVAIIPVIAGLCETDVPKVEALVGRIHMPIWFMGQQDTAPPFQTDALEQLINGLKIGIANKDLFSQAELFYEKGTQNVSLRYLTPEQVFLKAYGCLFGVDPTVDKGLGIKLMESILAGYAGDAEFARLQEQVADELIKHFYRTNQPELFLTYMKLAIAKKYTAVVPLLFEVYRGGWHAELLSHACELSFALLEDIYRKNFGKCWDGDAILASATAHATNGEAVPDSAFAQVGALHFEGHTAYFQKSSTEARTVNLVVDGRGIAKYDVYASYGDVYFLFMAYDATHRQLITLHSDFDHYGPETHISGCVYPVETEFTLGYGFASDWLRGMRPLPYSPHTFQIE